MCIFAPMKALEKIFKYIWMSVGILLGLFVLANILFIVGALVYTMLQGILMR